MTLTSESSPARNIPDQEKSNGKGKEEMDYAEMSAAETATDTASPTPSMHLHRMNSRSDNGSCSKSATDKMDSPIDSKSSSDATSTPFAFAENHEQVESTLHNHDPSVSFKHFESEVGSLKNDVKCMTYVLDDTSVNIAKTLNDITERITKLGQGMTSTLTAINEQTRMLEKGLDRILDDIEDRIEKLEQDTTRTLERTTKAGKGIITKKKLDPSPEIYRTTRPQPQTKSSVGRAGPNTPVNKPAPKSQSAPGPASLPAPASQPALGPVSQPASGPPTWAPTGPSVNTTMATIGQSSNLSRYAGPIPYAHGYLNQALFPYGYPNQQAFPLPYYNGYSQQYPYGY